MTTRAQTHLEERRRAMELSKTFDSKSAEEHWFQLWVDRGYFTADPARPGPVFSIVIPPPNVTGQLHLGHALIVTLHDIIVRARRMQGFNTLWLPGTDHAGIATQNVVEREIAKEGKTRHDLGREAFVKRVSEWRETYGGRILNQLRRLGASCDWSRERFTLDEGLSRAVTKVFVQLYNDKLVYRDFRLINWCPRCETALSDLEVDHKDTKSSLWFIRYPFADGLGEITVATTRPETMLGDSAVAVNPEDERFKATVGKTVRLPLIGREIPIVADAAVDKEFGTGAVKITPGHDFNDFELGRRHRLAQISVMDLRGRMNAEAGPYQGLTREECRRRVVDDLKSQRLLEKIEPHQHAIGVCSRCETTVEPMLSYQWFMAVNKPDASGQSIAGRAIAAVEQGATTFHPKFWENTYFSWMRNLQDWCISRQLWWGHRIPAYWCERCENGQPIVAEERPHACPQCGGSDIRQDDDVLDTWFSSGLWPFSTLGWPDRTVDLEKYYPTSLLITAFDIIFFWVARMMMFGLKVNPRDADSMNEQVPFRDVYITPLVRDAQGKKMTKSRGNVVDPLEIMDRFGTDAVRFTLAQLTVQGRDLILSDERLAASRAFANKVWNAARFVLMNLEGAPQPVAPVDVAKLGLAERWIMSRLDRAIREVSSAIDAYEFNHAALIVYQFVWHEFCDWYIELAKETLKAGGERQAAARYVLVTCFDRMLRIVHPFMPFVSEEIWQALRPYIGDAYPTEHLAVAKWPAPAERDPLSDAEADAMERCIAATQAINSLRSLAGHHPGQRVRAVLRMTLEQGAFPVIESESGKLEMLALHPGMDFPASLQPGLRHFDQWKDYVALRACLTSLDVTGDDVERPAGMVFASLGWAEVGIETPAGFDFDKARGMLKKKLDEVRGHLQRHVNRYENPGFRAKADEETIAEIGEKIEELKGQERVLEGQIGQLG
jgi:valyl-tRNA synthetase